MATLRTKNRQLLFKIESTEGVDASPGASDAIQVENLQVRAPINNLRTNENTGSLDSASDVPAGAPVSFTFDTYLRGSGSTAGGVPEINPLLKCAGMTSVLTTVAVGAPTAATAAGSTATIAAVPSATFSGASDYYNGMPVVLTGNPTGPFDSAVIDSTSSGSTHLLTLVDTFSPSLNASTLVQVQPNALYHFHSGTIDSGTAYINRDGVRWIVVGCRGSFEFTLDANGFGKFSWSFTGTLSARADSALVTPSFAGAAVKKLVWNNRNGQSAMLLDRSEIAVRSFSFGCNNQLTAPPNPNQTDGFDPAGIFGREVRGRFDPKATLIATRDTLSTYNNGDTVIIGIRVGRTLGNRVAITFPAATLTNAGGDADQGGVQAEPLEFKADGQDRAAGTLAFY
jgi:hypothetical protein